MKKELEIFEMQLQMITLTIVRSRRGGGLCRAPASAEGKRVEFSVNSQSFGLSYFWLFLLGVAKVDHLHINLMLDTLIQPSTESALQSSM